MLPSFYLNLIDLGGVMNPLVYIYDLLGLFFSIGKAQFNGIDLTYMKGVVVNFDINKGYGFIRPKSSDRSVFVHINNVLNSTTLKKGQKVKFQIVETDKGLSAMSVTAGRLPLEPFEIFALLSVFMVIALNAYINQFVSSIWAYVFAINITSILVYGYDKMIAGTLRTRVPELILHGLTLFGGTFGSLFSQIFFRHKTRKDSFQNVFWSIVVIQAVLFFALIAMVIWLKYE